MFYSSLLPPFTRFHFFSMLTWIENLLFCFDRKILVFSFLVHGHTLPDSQSATTATANNKIDSDLSKTFINNTFVERPAASSSTEPNSKSTEYVSVIAILDQMREELELLRMSKQCNSTPDGSNCEVNGSWNSEQIGLRVELVNSMTDDKLTVKLSDKAPKKFSPFKIDSSWSCSGMVFRSIGGPIYFHCLKLPMETIAIFHGMCKKCSGYETIFGQWHFQHNPKECRQLWTFFETKNDIFRKDVLHSSNHDNGKWCRRYWRPKGKWLWVMFDFILSVGKRKKWM